MKPGDSLVSSISEAKARKDGEDHQEPLGPDVPGGPAAGGRLPPRLLRQGEEDLPGSQPEAGAPAQPAQGPRTQPDIKKSEQLYERTFWELAYGGTSSRSTRQLRPQACATTPARQRCCSCWTSRPRRRRRCSSGSSSTAWTSGASRRATSSRAGARWAGGAAVEVAGRLHQRPCWARRCRRPCPIPKRAFQEDNQTHYDDCCERSGRLTRGHDRLGLFDAARREYSSGPYENVHPSRWTA